MDDFVETQFQKLEFHYQKAEEYDVPIVFAGDLGKTPSWPNWLIKKYIDLFLKYEKRIKRVYLVPGQHDLPNHNLQLWEYGAIGILHSVCCLDVVLSPIITETDFALYPFPYGAKLQNLEGPLSGKPSLAVLHKMIINDPLFPGQQALDAVSLVKQMSGYDLILAGDNHQAFTIENKFINAGSMARTKSDQINHKPRIYLWGIDDGEFFVDEIFIPISEGVITRAHLDEAEERGNIRLEELKNRDMSYESKLDFVSNLESYFFANDADQEVRQLIFEMTNAKSEG
jgi:DNA repair exonuclease SbcCD nuclease subunit